MTASELMFTLGFTLFCSLLLYGNSDSSIYLYENLFLITLNYIFIITVISDSWKGCNTAQHPVSLLLALHGTRHTCHTQWTRFYQLNSILHSNFLLFPLMSFFSSRISSKISIRFSQNVSLGSCTIKASQTSLVFLMNLTLRRNTVGI